MGIPEPQNMVSGILCTVKNGSVIFRYHFFTVPGVTFPIKYGTGPGDPISRVSYGQFYLQFHLIFIFVIYSSFKFFLIGYNFIYVIIYHL